MNLTLEQFQQIFPSLPPGKAREYCTPFVQSLDSFQINTEWRLAAYAAQLGHESRDLTRWMENLNYSTAKRIQAVWPKRFPTIASALPFVRNPEGLANQVYSGRMGNAQPGDGWKYRGRGPIQATGKAMYDWLGEQLSLDLVRNPDLLLQPEIGFASAAAIYALEKACNPLADSGLETDFKLITKRINGGVNGWEDRKARWLGNQRILGIQIIEG